MGDNSNNRNLLAVRSIAPENTSRSRRVLLGVGLEHRLALIERIRQPGEFVCLKCWVAGVSGKIAESFLDLLDESDFSRQTFEALQLRVSGFSEA